MVERTLSGRYGSSEQREGYSVGKWLDSVLQHRVDERRQFLASRNAAGNHGPRPFTGRHGDDRLRGEPLGEEGHDE